MTRATGVVAARRRKKRRIKLASGYYGKRSKLYRTATEAVNRAMAYATRDRKAKKRNFRSLWIARVNAAVRQQGLTYNRFIEGLKRAKVEIDRKILAQLALDHPQAFAALVKIAKEQLEKKPKPKSKAKKTKKTAAKK